MISILSNLTPMSFSELKSEEMTLLHHAAYDSNVEFINMMKSLPYYQEIIDDNSNDVNYIF